MNLRDTSVLLGFLVGTGGGSLMSVSFARDRAEFIVGCVMVALGLAAMLIGLIAAFIER